MTRPGVLTEALISQMCRAPLAEVRRLNLWSRQLHDVSILSDILNLEILCLLSHRIQDLDIFPVCPSLLSLILRNNQIEYLSRLPKLHALWLAENPIAAEPDDHTRVVEMLPNLITLDEIDVTSVDRTPPLMPVPRKFPATARFGADSDFRGGSRSATIQKVTRNAKSAVK
jgi:hypothetical protein